MKHRLWLTFIALTFTALYAHGQSGLNPVSPEEVFRKRAEDSFQNHDVDKDGYLVGEEIPGDIRSLLELARASPDTRIDLRQFLEYRESAYRLQVAANFKHRDRNEDGFLQKHEMPLALMKHLAKYSNGGERVNFQEFLRFSMDRDFAPPPPRVEPAKSMGTESGMPAPVIIDYTDVEKRPMLYRAGNLPKGLPEWFERLDKDRDGQVSLNEWWKGGMPLEDFELWDRNDDGLITFEEVLSKLKLDRESREK